MRAVCYDLIGPERWKGVGPININVNTVAFGPKAIPCIKIGFQFSGHELAVELSPEKAMTLSKALADYANAMIVERG